MQRKRIAILGGSSPFTAGLINALRNTNFDDLALRLVLHGRNQANLDLIKRYARTHLASGTWEVDAINCMPKALEDAAIVVHQIRYDGLSGRAQGEQLCEELGVAADETLGPAALLTGLRTMPDLQRTCANLRDICPNATVLNLTNPLSAVTSAMHHFGVWNCVGLCELPLVTAAKACSLLGVDLMETNWTYSGLNHRGFIDTFRRGKEDLIPRLARMLSHENNLGISASDIDELQAIPLKYFGLVRSPTIATAGRATVLKRLRDQLCRELAQSPEASPPSLRRRYMDWYPRSVVPLIRALLDSQPTRHILNTRRDDDLVVETFAQVAAMRIEPEFHAPANPVVRHWNERFEAHEQAFVRALLAPGHNSIRMTLKQDPMLSDFEILPAVTRLLEASSRGLQHTH